MKIPKRYAHLAVEYTGRHLQNFREGDNKAVNIEKAQDFSEVEQSSMQSFFEEASSLEGLNNSPGVQFDELKATLRNLHSELKAVDLNNDGIDEAERANMSKAGQAAMQLAEHMMTQEPTQTMAVEALDGLSPEEVVATVRNASVDHVELGYDVARAIMFAHIDNQEGTVQEVYTNKSEAVVGVPETNVMNTEHTWPKSRGVKDTPAISDLHHLFPTDQAANAKRASYPFGIVEKVLWSGASSKLGTNDKGHIVFEPPPEHRGNIARALFYVATVYDLELLEGEPEILLQWNNEDPVDANERKRNDDISRFQKNRNPFIDHPELAEAIASALPTRPVPAKMFAN
ncbi:MAG: hypothetical protein EP343_09285 [Deltaproteobacteria bacterium]|nr:MAG: hypothetical protein EP343_09285 [Deltaproteobacteria bacterium]